MGKKENIYKIASFILIIDQIIKFFLSHTLNLYDSIKIIPGFFQIFLIKNTGAAFSILKDNTIFIIIITIIFLLFLNYYIIKEENFSKLSILSLGMIIGGVFGNLLDRFIYYGVIDYLSFCIFRYDFPIFNLADISITVGILLVLFELTFSKIR